MRISTIPTDTQELILHLNKSGMNGREIEKELAGRNIIIAYHKINTYIKSIMPKKVSAKQLIFIESATALCESTTKWINKLQDEYNAVHVEDITAEIEEKVVCDKTGEELRRYLQMSPAGESMRKERDRIREQIGINLKTLAEFLKTPTIQNTQVNIVQQRMEGAYKRILDESGVTRPISR